jgi:hypothetical protein
MSTISVMDKSSARIFTWVFGGFAITDICALGGGMFALAQNNQAPVPCQKTIYLCQVEGNSLCRVEALYTVSSTVGCALVFDGSYLYTSGSNTSLPSVKRIDKIDLKSGALIERYSTVGTIRAFQTFDGHYMYYNSAGTITQYDLEYNPIDSFVADTANTFNVCWDGQDFYTCILWGMGFYNLHKILRNGSVCPAMGLITGPLAEVDEQYVYSIV